jgi:hypothetical protein
LAFQEWLLKNNNALEDEEKLLADQKRQKAWYDKSLKDYNDAKKEHDKAGKTWGAGTTINSDMSKAKFKELVVDKLKKESDDLKTAYDLIQPKITKVQTTLTTLETQRKTAKAAAEKRKTAETDKKAKDDRYWQKEDAAKEQKKNVKDKKTANDSLTKAKGELKDITDAKAYKAKE